MENASKALLMAGGILLTLVAVSVFYYMFSKIGEFRGITEDNPIEQEVLDFNESFEAYNKKLMYGVDIISVINKAIDNNKKYKVENETDNEYYVNVVFSLKSGLSAEKYEYSANGRLIGDPKTLPGTALKANKQYNLKNADDYAKIKNILISVVETYADPDNPNETYHNQSSSFRDEKDDGSYTITYYPAAEFKRRMFTCTGVKYDSKIGRITEMAFKEYEGS